MDAILASGNDVSRVVHPTRVSGRICKEVEAKRDQEICKTKQSRPRTIDGRSGYQAENLGRRLTAFSPLYCASASAWSPCLRIYSARPKP
jgi:hypothetical protein